MVNIIKEKDCLTLSGHAYYAPKGGDTVCAAVSILCYALGEYLKGRGIEAETEIKKGYFRLRCGDKRGREAFAFAMAGLELLSRAFPENVHIEGERK